jgi:hypothetical protein
MVRILFFPVLNQWHLRNLSRRSLGEGGSAVKVPCIFYILSPSTELPAEPILPLEGLSLFTGHFFRHYENGKKAQRSFAEIDSSAGVSRLQND